MGVLLLFSDTLGLCPFDGAYRQLVSISGPQCKILERPPQMTNQVLQRAQCKALIHGSIFPGKNQYISPLLVILDGVRGDRTRNPWVAGSAVKCFITEPNPLASLLSSLSRYLYRLTCTLKVTCLTSCLSCYLAECEADRTKEALCLGLLTGQIDRNRLADHGPDVQRPKTVVRNTLMNIIALEMCSKTYSLHTFTPT